ncbi:MAG TPA: hypothetical protein VIT89_00605 [Solirubrobacterales bacterium]
MKYLKNLGLAAIAAMAFMAFAASSASATTSLEVNGEAKANVFITATIESGNSALLQRTDGSFANTCTESHVEGTSGANGGTTVTGTVSNLSFSKCTRPVSVHAGGTLHIEHTAGTDGTVSSSGAQVTVGSIFGTLNCKTNTGTHLGNVTGTDGTPKNHAIMHINAVIDCGFLVPSAKWEGTYVVTTPTGLGVTA